MTITAILSENTFTDPAAAIALVDLRKRYRDVTGKTIPRTLAVAQLAAAGVQMGINNQGMTVIPGYSWRRPLRWTVQDGKAVKVPA